MSLYKGNNLISGVMPNSANQSLSNLNSAGQDKFDAKVDLDLTNVNNVGYIKMAGASMPSSTYTDLTLGASGSTYTAPANGYVRFTAVSNNANFAHVQLYGRVAMRCPVTATGALVAAFIPVFKGESFTASYQNVNSTGLRFYYAEGEV